MGRAKRERREPREPKKLTKFNPEEIKEIAEAEKPMAEEKQGFEQGQRVKFRRSHDKSLELTGTVVRVHSDADLVDIATEPDGKVLEVETIETAHFADVTPIEEPTEE